MRAKSSKVGFNTKVFFYFADLKPRRALKPRRRSNGKTFIKINRLIDFASFCEAKKGAIA
jgi:hypothetical protein